MKPYNTIDTKPQALNDMLVKYETTSTSTVRLILAANKGIKADTISDLVSISNHKKDFFAGLLNLSVKTLDRYTSEGKSLSPSNGEMVLKLISLYRKGAEVFGSVKSFNNWLDKPSIGLGNSLPVTFMYTSGGIDLIQEELSRIEFGDLA